MAKKSDSPNQVIAIGASAGGLEPLQSVISHLPDRLEDTAIIIAQHTSPDYKSMLVSLLGKLNEMEIFEAKDGMVLKSEAIYTIPPDTDAHVLKGRFVFNRPSKVGPKPSIDRLFISLAEEFKKNCIGVILSGTGHDGSKGIVDIKKQKGFILIQDPESAKYSGMPQSAIKTGVVDLVLSPEEMGEELPKLFDPDYRLTRVNEVQDMRVDDTSLSALSIVLNLLQEKTQTDFSGYKTSTIYRRLDKRISDKNFSDIHEYAEYLGKEMGIYKNPYEQFGRLTYEMWRACRLVVDVGLHYKGWSRDEAVAFMTNNTALSLLEVNNEIDRYIGWPGQAISYKIGELTIKDLRKRCEEKYGTDFHLPTFHDNLLRNGSMPLSTLSRLILDEYEHVLKEE